jgi:hypothetical protein
MVTVALTPEQKRQAVEAVEKYGNIPAAWNALSDAGLLEPRGLTEPAFRHRYRMGVKAGLDEKIVTAAPTGHTIKGVSTLYGADGSIAAQWVKTRSDEPSLDDITEAVRAAFDGYQGKSPLVPVPEQTDADIATVVPLADLHIGLLAWHRETGGDWDLTIAQTILKATTARLMAATTPSSTCVILGLGDLLHSDGYDPVTARSKNQLDVDGRWPKVLRVAVELIIYAVDVALAKHANVLVRLLPGNHDLQSAIAVALALSLYYANNPRVTVDDDPSYFWWWSWGTALLGATHGDRAKMADLPLIMAARNPEAWGRAKHRHILTGHIHKQTGIEVSGVTVESFRTPVAPDAWHHGMGYGAGRSMTAITLHKTDGEIGRVRANIVNS